jgi:hypothetical protein
VHLLIDGPSAFRCIGKAIDEGQRSVWLTVAFYAPDFRMPDSHASRPGGREASMSALFSGGQIPRALASVAPLQGSSADRDMLHKRSSRFRARWVEPIDIIFTNLRDT